MTIFPTDKQAEAALFAVELEDTITKFVRGLRGPRLNPVTQSTIYKHVTKFPMFAILTSDQIGEAIDCCINDERFRLVALSLSAHRKWNGRYGYTPDWSQAD